MLSLSFGSSPWARMNDPSTLFEEWRRGYYIKSEGRSALNGDWCGFYRQRNVICGEFQSSQPRVLALFFDKSFSLWNSYSSKFLLSSLCITLLICGVFLAVSFQWYKTDSTGLKVSSSWVPLNRLGRTFIWVDLKLSGTRSGCCEVKRFFRKLFECELSEWLEPRDLNPSFEICPLMYWWSTRDYFYFFWNKRNFSLPCIWSSCTRAN